jgi:hypothetical protein
MGLLHGVRVTWTAALSKAVGFWGGDGVLALSRIVAHEPQRQAA